MLAVLLLEARQVGAEVAGAVDLELAGELTAPERAVGHDAHAELARRRHDLLLEPAREQRPLALERRDRVCRVGGAERFGAHLGEPEVADLAGLHELAHRAHALLDRHARVAAVHVVEVDVVHAEAAQGGVAGFADPLGAVVDRAPARVVAADRELAGELQLVAASLDRAAQELLVVPRPVHVGGVEEGHADVERAADRRGRLVLVRGSVELGHPHAAESDRGYLEVSELALVHGPDRTQVMGPARPARTRAAGA